MSLNAHSLIQGEEALTQVAPPPSCLSDTSVLISTILRYTPDLSSAASMKVETLLQVWANLIVDWNAWEEEEDEAVFDAIGEAVALQVYVQIPLFCVELTLLDAVPFS